MKNFLLLVLFGAVMGAIIFAWFSPQLISWYFSPPADLAFSCKSAVEWGVVVFRKVVFTGMFLSAVTFAVLYFALRSRKGRPAPAPLSDPETPAN